MSTPKRIQMSRQHPWRAENPDAVRIDRTTRYGNPFRILGGQNGRGGSIMGPAWSDAVANWGRPVRLDEYPLYITTSAGAELRAHAARLFRTLCAVRRRDEPERFETWIAPLRGHDVACWCSLDADCHGDVLIEFANPGLSGPPALLCPECRNGKHRICIGWTLDDNDHVVDCTCTHEDA